MNRTRSQLLVSVRSVREAEAAFAGGADLIDIKEPARGPLGQADATTIAEIIAAVAGRRPVSAAGGELREQRNLDLPFSGPSLAYVKFGLSGYRSDLRWQTELAARMTGTNNTPDAPQVVVAAYADGQAADAPPAQDVVAFACRHPGSVLLIDTWNKAPGLSLLDWISLEELTVICQRCRAAGVRIALAGSLGLEQIKALRVLQPDWFGVRGAACANGRDSQIREEKVRQLARLLETPIPVATGEN